MSLGKKDIKKLSYKAKIEWYKERVAQIVSDEEEDIEKGKDLSPDEIISILNDLNKKAGKLIDKIDYLSAGLQIPVDKEKNPTVSEYVAELDPESGGEYLSFELYSELLKQQYSADSNVDLMEASNNYTGESETDSLYLQSKMSEGFQKVADKPEGNDLERYTNRYLNNILSWNEHNYKVRQITNFADNYLGMFPDPAYIPWQSKKDIYYERGEVDSLTGLWKNFSSSYTDDVKHVLGGVSGLASLRPDGSIRDVTTRYIDYFNGFMNGLNDTFGFNYAADLLCCFFQWAGRLDTKTLKGLRALLQLVKSGVSFDFTDIINSIKDMINNIFRGLILNQLMGFINQVFQRLVDPIKKWINNPDENWERVFVCTPVDELIRHFIVGGIEYIEDELGRLIKKFYNKYQLKELDFNIKGTLLKEQKQLGVIVKMLDAVIAVLDKSSVCGTLGSPEGEPVKKMMQAYNIGPDEEFEFPKEDNPNIYNSFIPETPEKSEGQKEQESASIPVSKKFDTSVDTGKKLNFDECLKRVMPDDFIGVTKWIKEINAEEAKGST